MFQKIKFFIKSFLSDEKQKRFIVLIIGCLSLFSLGLYFYTNRSVEKKQYVEAYSLVSDSVSKSAAITVSLPEGVVKETAHNYLTFYPEIAGSWVNSNSANHITFQPSEPLPIDRYYKATLDMQQGDFPISKEFHVVEDPKIEAIFPNEGSETSEYSSITIIFNRPMVPLTTLSELEETEIPIEITPATKGKFKWISTRNLQFIPEERLIRSSNYTFSVKEGFVSMDGLPIQVLTTSFITKPLRHEFTSNGVLRYDNPVSIKFNQPVDIDKTADEITIENFSTGKKIDFIAEYNQYVRKDPESGKDQTVVDRSTLKIYPKVDSHGRARLWDFKTSYNITLNKAFPLEGDIIFNNQKKSQITITDIIESVEAKGERSSHISTSLFDPKGTLTIQFYEGIDLKRSKITAKGLVQIEYDKKCEEEKDGDENIFFYISDKNCKKVDDTSRIILSFNPEELSLGENFNVEFKKIYNESGLKLNTETLLRNITVYPSLKILKVTPNETGDASLTEMIICSNTPLKTKDSENFKESIKTDGYLVFVRWRSPYKETGTYQRTSPCSKGEYINKIQYGLLPEKDYIIRLSVEDDFGGQATQTVSFGTTKPSGSQLRVLDLQKTYNVTTPDKTKFTYAAENFTYANVSICRTDPVFFLKELENQPSETTPPDSKNCLSIVKDTVDLPDTFWVNHYFQINLADYFDDTRGQYIITITHPNFKNKDSDLQKYHRTYASVTNLAVVEKKVDFSKYDVLPGEIKQVEVPSNGNIYWVSQINPQKSISNALVFVYKEGEDKKDIILADSKLTDSQGIAQVPYEKDIVGAVIKKGEESAILSSWADKLNYAWGGTEDEKTYIYTDRPIYRPGDKVFIKGLYRVHYDGDYNILTDKESDIKIYNSKGEKILSEKILMNDYGAFSTFLELPIDSPLGSYRITAFNNSTYVDVQEYVSSAYEASVESNKEEYIAGENVDMTISAKYYFGVPLDGGEVEYTFTAQDYYFDKYKDEYFNFGGDWYYCYECGYGDSYIGQGKTTLDRNGIANIQKKLDFTDMFNEGERGSSKIIVLHATITDLQGRSLSVQKSFIVHRGEYYLGLKTDQYFVGVGEKVTARAKTVDVEGIPVSQKNIDLVVSRIEWKSYKRKEVDGGYYNKWEKEKTPVIQKTIRTNNSGDWNEELLISQEGQYEISLSGEDGIGNTLTTTENIYVYGSGNVNVRPTNNETLEIEIAKQDLDVGDTAEIIIKSPYKKAKALISIDRGQVFDYEVVDIDKNLYKYSFKIKKEYIPNIHISVLLLSSDPEVKFGQEELFVNRKENTLNINVKTNKDQYLPGEIVSLNITTTDSKNLPVEADVSIAVADLSVLALKGNQKKNPLVFFYQSFPLTVVTSTNIKNILEEAEIPTGTKGGGGTASEADDLATKKRGTFKDTAFWQAHIVTDSNGQANISFTLPDNLTRWQIESIGITKDTKVGVDYKEFTSRKNVMNTPISPRFVVPGDEFYIGAKIFNQLSSTQKLNITFSSETLSLLEGEGLIEKEIKGGGTETVYFKVQASPDKKEGEHRFVLSAKNDNYEDTVEKSISITPNTTYETVATAYQTTEDRAYEYVKLPDNVLPDQGGLTIKANATMAVFLSDALNYLIGFPYGCSEQISSKLSAIAILKEGLSLPNAGDDFVLDEIEFEGKIYNIDEVVSLGLTKIYETQSSSGGFSFYRQLNPNLSLTMHVLDSLQDVKNAGYSVRETVMISSANYIVSEIERLEKTSSKVSTDTLIDAVYVLSRLDNVPKNIDSFRERMISRISEDYLNEKISSNSLAKLAILTATSDNYSSLLKKQAYDQLENRIDIDSRGAYLKTNNNNIARESYETKIKNTALLLKALVADEKDSPLQGNIVRWLLASRSKDGAWGSTNNTLTVIDSFTDFLKWSRETESDFQLDVNLDEKILASFDFNPKTILNTYEYSVPMSEIELNVNHILSFNRIARNNKDNRFYYDIGLQYYFPVQNIPPRDEGITVERAFYHVEDKNNENPVLEAKVGDVLRGEIIITTPKPRREFSLESIIPAGVELINFDLNTEDSTSLLGENSSSFRFLADGVLHGKSLYQKNNSLSNLASSLASIFSFGNKIKKEVVYLSEQSSYKKFVRSLSPDFKELRDDRLFLFKEYLNSGTYKYEYYVRVTTPGTFQYLPTLVSELYFPENFGRTAGETFIVTKD